jgi:hypothetical protein
MEAMTVTEATDAFCGEVVSVEFVVDGVVLVYASGKRVTMSVGGDYDGQWLGLNADGQWLGIVVAESKAED